MKVYEFGKKSAPALLLLPGTCCHWKGNFGRVIPLLEKNFRVLCVSYDGFDETENTEFPTMPEETEKIEAYIKEHCSGHIHGAYGCSLGGVFCGPAGGAAKHPHGLWHFGQLRSGSIAGCRRKITDGAALAPALSLHPRWKVQKPYPAKKSFKNAWGRRKPMCRRLWTCWAAGGLM